MKPTHNCLDCMFDGYDDPPCDSCNGYSRWAARPASQVQQVRTAPVVVGNGLLPDFEIRRLAAAGMIQPFAEGVNSPGTLSYGLSSYGYDVRAASEWKIFTNVNSTTVDPKNFDPKSFVTMNGPECIIPPNSFVLTSSVEYFKIPRDVMVVCMGKSTYARCGLVVNVTPLEADWEGHVTLEISNTTPLPAKVYANEGIAQFLFFRGAAPCEVSYADKGGKYQRQTGVTLSR